MTREQAETFYAVHKARPFFGELVDFMTSGPVVVQVLQGEGAVLKYRDVMGATDPSKAADGTIRKVHAKSIGENSVQVRTRQRPPRSKSRSSSQATKSSVDRRRGDIAARNGRMAVGEERCGLAVEYS